MYGFITGSSGIPLVYLSVALPVPWFVFFVVVVGGGGGLFVCLFVCLFYQNSSVVQLEIMHGESTRGSFIIEKSFCYPRFFVVPDEFAK